MKKKFAKVKNVTKNKITIYIYIVFNSKKYIIHHSSTSLPYLLEGNTTPLMIFFAPITITIGVYNIFWGVGLTTWITIF